MESQNHHFPVVVSQIITVEHWGLWEKSCLCHSGQKAERRQEVKIDFKSLDISQFLSQKTWYNIGMEVMRVINCFLIGFESYRLTVRWEFMPGIINSLRSP